MKPRLAVAAIFLGTLAAALWFFGAFTTPNRPLGEDAPPPPPPPATDARLFPKVEAEPKDEPEPDVARPTGPVRVLVLGETRRSFSAWLEQLWSFVPDVRWRAWYATKPPEGVLTSVAGVPALDGPPTLADLDEAQVLVIAGFDPSRLPGSFWEHAADRVRTRAMGLLLLPDPTFGRAMSEIEALRALLPVAKVHAFAAVAPGGPVAGVYLDPRPLVLTKEGAAHAAARIVEYPNWNRHWWASLGEGGAKAAWSTKFCSPVDTLSPGAVVLARLATGADPVPAIVASGDDLRVLWAGGVFDLEDAAYRSGRSAVAMRALVHRWLAWLSAPRT